MERRSAHATAESAYKGLHTTTNLEGGHGEREEVSSQLVCLFFSLRNNSNWFRWLLVSLDFLVRHKVTMSSCEPGLLLEECLAEGMVLGGSLAEEYDDEVGQRVNE